MAKRFTDTELWSKEWFQLLSCKHKCFFQYLFSNCNAAGIWDTNFRQATFVIGEDISEKDIEILNKDKKRLIKLSNGSYFLIDFIDFQYGTLSEKCNPHIPIIKILKKYYKEIKGYLKGLDTLMDKEQDKDKDKDKEQETEKEKYGQQKNIELTAIEKTKLFEEFGEPKTNEAIEYLSLYKAEKNYKTTSDNLTLRRWVFDAIEQKVNKKELETLIKKNTPKNIPKTKSGKYLEDEQQCRIILNGYHRHNTKEKDIEIIKNIQKRWDFPESEFEALCYLKEKGKIS